MRLTKILILASLLGTLASSTASAQRWSRFPRASARYEARFGYAPPYAYGIGARRNFYGDSLYGCPPVDPCQYGAPNYAPVNQPAPNERYSPPAAPTPVPNAPTEAAPPPPAEAPLPDAGPAPVPAPLFEPVKPLK